MAKQIKVLMVDDEERFRATTSKLLEKRGFQTTIAGSGEDAIAILKKEPHDVVILDIKMPGMDGHEALSLIKELRPEIQVIMLTGHGTLESADNALIQKAFDYLNKPCDIDILAVKINDAYKKKHHGELAGEKKVKDIMIHIEDYTSLSIDNTVKDSIKKLMESFKNLVSSSRIMETGHRSMLVFDHNKKLAGILSIMDLIEAVRPAYLSAPKPSTADSIEYSSMFWEGLFTTQTKAMADLKIGDIMSESPPVIDGNSNLMEAADLMYTTQLRRLIVTADEKLAGVIREQELFFEMANIII